jgi:transcriptional regulator with XRE-family HTH domain
MEDKVEIITLGKFIQEARIKENMSISDIALKMNKNNTKYYEKKITLWEKNKDFPDLNDIYLLAEILNVDPTLMLTIRDRTRKNIYGIERKPRKNYAWLENFLDDLFHVFLPAIFGFYIVALIVGINVPFSSYISSFLNFLFSGISSI